MSEDDHVAQDWAHEVIFGTPTHPTGVGSLIKVQLFAELLDVSERTVQRWIKNKEIPAFSAGRGLRIPSREAVKFIRDRQVQNADLVDKINEPDDDSDSFGEESSSLG